jgi:threonine/homoserine/homoserine lactone efflux protein
VTVSLMDAALFSLAAIVLLGSPGPGIAALIAVGKNEGFARGLGFYGGLQAGLALAAGISAAGLFSVIEALPFAVMAMTVAATLYLLYLAWRIATAPVGAGAGPAAGVAATPAGGFLLGITNPKSYIAFASLMASYPIIRSDTSADAALKWLLCVVVMVVVDILWLWVGVAIERTKPRPSTERAINIAMAAVIAATALFALL